MSKTKSTDERAEFLSGLGLNAGAGGLADMPAKITSAVTHVATPSKTVTLAPPGVDPRMMAVDDIVFDDHLLDQFPSLEGDGLRAASDYVFSLYKSYGKNKERNAPLHRKITSFITLTRRNRETGGMVKEKVKTSKPERDMAALLASQEVGVSDLAEALALLAEKRGK